ncbi:MAG: hypothetical protein ABIP75_07780 [Pyrinomonadaceae bacterium]
MKRSSLLFGLILTVACSFALVPAVLAQADETPSMSPAAAKQIIQNRARQVILAIQAKNMNQLANYVHPTKGVRFSSYSYVDKDGDLVFRPAQVRDLGTSKRRYHWGEYDGSGDPIRMTFDRYYREFVYDKNFARAPEIRYNEISGGGTIIINIFSSYPGAIVVDHYFPPTEGEMDWRSLRLAFQKRGSVWYLVGIIHNEWTI